MPFGNPGPFPLPAADGPTYLKFHQYQPAYAEVIQKHIYEDGGFSTVAFNDTAPIRFLIEYDGLPVDDVAILDAHRADAFGEVYGFTLTNPQTEEEFEDVHYDEEFEEDHTRVHVNRRTIHLIKRPA